MDLRDTQGEPLGEATGNLRGSYTTAQSALFEGTTMWHTYNMTSFGGAPFKFSLLVGAGFACHASNTNGSQVRRILVQPKGTSRASISSPDAL